MDADRQERIRRLARAVHVHLDFNERRGTSEDRERILRENAELRDLLEPMLDPRGASVDVRERVLGDFEIRSELGRGGMGVVYEANQVSLGRRVALKVLPVQELAGERALWRFQREARLAAQLDHPNLVKVFDTGTDGDLHWIAMELVRGAPLNRVLDAARSQGLATATEETVHRAVDAALTDVAPRRVEAPPLDGADQARLKRRSYVQSVVGIAVQVADALQHAHDRGVVHRDVKPANILIRQDGTAMLTDFGIARQEGLPSMTLTGDFAGTPYYVSPEQALAKSGTVDHRSDVYSLGATLYELVTLRRPFEGETTHEILARILRQEPPDPAHLNPRLAPDLAAILLKTLEKDPSRRYATAADLASDLRAFLDYRPVTARRPGTWTRLRKWVRREPLKAALAATVAAAAVALLSISAWFTSKLIQEGQVAQKALADFNLLANAVRLEEARDEAAGFQPAWPNRVSTMESWLHDTAEPLAALLPDLEIKLAELRQRAVSPGTGAAPADRGEYWFDAPEDRFLHEQLAHLVGELEAFAEDPRGAMAVVREKLDWARNVERLSLREAAEEWRGATRAIAASAHYGGLELKPQIGLVPIGVDPESGLWEFLHLRSGSTEHPIPARGADGRLVITEDTGIVFVLVPAGGFVMGAQSGDPEGANYDPAAEDDEAPVRMVDLAPHFLSKYELTQAQWRRLSRGGVPALYNPTRPKGRHPHPVTWTNPVENVSWEDCAELLRSHGLDLPTEAQWERACRARTDTPWSFGLDHSSFADYGNLCGETAHREAGWIPEEGVDDGHLIHSPAGCFLPNGFGFFDMHGNVYEWCKDGYASYTRDPRDGDAMRSSRPTDAGIRVIRGGSYKWHAVSSRSSERFGNKPLYRNDDLGLRPARRILPGDE